MTHKEFQVRVRSLLQGHSEGQLRNPLLHNPQYPAFKGSYGALVATQHSLRSASSAAFHKALDTCKVWNIPLHIPLAGTAITLKI